MGADVTEWLDKRSAVESLRSSEPDWRLSEFSGGARRGAGRGLSSDARELLRTAGTTCQYARGETLFEQDQPSSSVLLIDHGMAKVFAVRPDGSQVLLAVRGTGDLVGAFSVNLPKTTANPDRMDRS